MNVNDIVNIIVRGMCRRAFATSDPKDQFKTMDINVTPYIENWDLVFPNRKTIYYTSDNFRIGPWKEKYASNGGK